MKETKESTADRACRDVIGLLSDYIDGDLSEADRGAIDRHMAGCPPCEEFLRSLSHTVRQTGQIRTETVPPEVLSRLRSFLKLRIDR